MKIASFKKKRETFDAEVRDSNGDVAVFTLLPLPADLFTVVNAFLGGGQSMLSRSQRVRFIGDCLVGWSGIKDEDGGDVEFSEKNAMQLSHADHEDLITELISASFLKRQENAMNLEKDKEELGKSQTK